MCGLCFPDLELFLEVTKNFIPEITSVVVNGWDEAAEKLIAQEPPLRVYLDINNMPRVDGLEILRLLRSEPRFSEVPVFYAEYFQKRIQSYKKPGALVLQVF